MSRVEHKGVHEPDRVRELPAITLNLVISSTTRGLVEEGGLRSESRGPQSLKGLSTPIEVFALVTSG